MPNYKAMYLTLFNAYTKAIEILQKAQQDAEEHYMSEESSENDACEAFKGNEFEKDVVDFKQ